MKLNIDGKITDVIIGDGTYDLPATDKYVQMKLQRIEDYLIKIGKIEESGTLKDLRYLTNKVHCYCCKGGCCKVLPCAFATWDFSLINEDIINKALETGLVSIHKWYPWDYCSEYVYVLRPTQINQKTFSGEKYDTDRHGCRLLVHNDLDISGPCVLNSTFRPTEGLLLYPFRQYECENLFGYYVVENWREYQSILEKCYYKYFCRTIPDYDKPASHSRVLKLTRIMQGLE